MERFQEGDQWNCHKGVDTAGEFECCLAAFSLCAALGGGIHADGQRN